MEDQSCKTPRWRMLKSRLNNLEPKAFSEKMKNCPDPVLIDVRRADEFELGHIPGAVNIDYLSDEFWDRMENYHADSYFFIYCRSGRRSIRACTLMRNGGFNNSHIYNLEGGFTAWQEIFEEVK